MRDGLRRVYVATVAALALTLVGAPWFGEAVADSKLILTTWRIEPSTVKENQPWTVKLWVGNVGSDAPRKNFTVQVMECDKDYAKCDTVHATQEVKLAAGDLGPGKLPGKEVVIEIKKGLGKGDHYIQFVVDAKKEVIATPIKKQVIVPVGFQKF